MAPMSTPSSRYRLWQVKADVVIVHDLALGADREIGGNETRGSRELPHPFRHFPDHRSPLHPVDRARSEDTLAQRLEGHLASLARSEEHTSELQSPMYL